MSSGPDQMNIEVMGTGFTTLDLIYADGQPAGEALGGSCGNVLLSLARLRRRVAPVLALGLDDVGGYLEDEFRRAGAVTSYIARLKGITSPVLVELVETATGRHRFSSTAPDSSVRYARYRSIDREHARAAQPAIEQCSVFYTDRISDSIVESMEAAFANGATVFLEPSAIDDSVLFQRALRSATIFKCSVDRIAHVEPTWLGDAVVAIVTHGARGLLARQGQREIWCDALAVERVIDTCGSGDMLSVGIIDWLLTTAQHGAVLDVASLHSGIRLGQRLAAANCAFVGARGVFQAYGDDGVRRLLSESV